MACCLTATRDSRRHSSHKELYTPGQRRCGAKPSTAKVKFLPPYQETHIPNEPECLQIREDGDLAADSVSEEDERIPILRQISENFTWDNFCYAFFLGLLPTAWDILTDFQFGVREALKQKKR